MESTQEVGKTFAPKKNILFEVRSVSKTLAAILFITLPFIGGWIGYIFGNNNNNTEKEIVSSIETNAPDTEKYVPEAGFTYNTIETIDAVMDGVIVSTSSTPFYDEPIPSDIIAQANQGYKRFTGPGYNYSAPSDYLYKDNTVFYLPVGTTSTPKVLIKSPQSFKTYTENLALSDGTIYYKGEVFQKSKTLTRLLYDYYASDSTIFSPEDSQPETRGLAIKTIFENVDSSTLASVKGLGGNPYTPTKERGPAIFQDTQFLYCLESGYKIALPINITFTPAPEEFDPYNQFINFTDSSGNEGSIAFTETTTGYQYNDKCERL